MHIKTKHFETADTSSLDSRWEQLLAKPVLLQMP